MKSILFVFRKSLKNAFFEMLHHPTKLIAYLLFAFFILSSIFNLAFSDASMSAAAQQAADFLDIGILHGIFIAVTLFIGIPTILMGVGSGTTLFSMSDVNLLFVSPISSKKMLIYGLVRKTGATLFLFFIFLTYSKMAMDMFSLSVVNSVVLVLCVFVFLLITQILSLLCFSFSNNNTKRITLIKTILFACVAAIIAIALLDVWQNGLSYESAVNAIKNPLIEYVPLFGWIKGLTFGIIEANVFKTVFFGGLMALTTVLSILFFAKVNTDYYEDVLQNTETTFEMRQAIKQGKMVDKNTFANRKTKVTDTGINHGKGASAFFFKHVREIRRQSKVAFVSKLTLTLTATCVIMSLFSRIDSQDGMPTGIVLAIITATAVYMQFFFTMTDEWNKEILKPYIYLVPASPYKKMIWASAISMIKPFIDSAIAFTISGIIIGAKPFTVLMCILTYASFGFIYTTVNILTERFVGGVTTKGIIIFIYILFVGIICAPGVAGGIAYMVYADGTSLMLSISALPVIIWNTIASALVFLICKESLHTMETGV